MKMNKSVIDEKTKTSGLKATTDYVKDLLVSGPEGVLGKGVELGLGAVLAKTMLRRLPVPLNFVVPFLAEKVMMKHGVEQGRELLLNTLRWVKKATGEKPALTLQTVQL